MDHFFFSYPSKLAVWEDTLSHHTPAFTLTHAQKLLFNGIFPPSIPHLRLEVLVVSITAHAIWRAHW
ncbi:hypothetical protein CLU79DRAFT_770799 [Phycomyces nitens]|nr:hypothetical protein CLU79DRAFT_770799 [Phycomyces nitens]